MSSEIEVAVLFADVVGSTELYEVLGDLKARDTIARCLDIMKNATEDNQGSDIKTIGDEVMATFPTADDALNAAREMQSAIGKGDMGLQHSAAHRGLRNPAVFGWLALAAVIVGFDQWTKHLAATHLVLYQPQEVFAWLNWRLAHNPGAAFSLLAGAGGYEQRVRRDRRHTFRPARPALFLCGGKLLAGHEHGHGGRRGR